MIEVRGEVEIVYVVGEMLMVSYVNMYLVLNVKCVVAVSENSSEVEGSRVMCVGLMDVGKSMVCFILCNYVMCVGYVLLYVDLDLG